MTKTIKEAKNNNIAPTAKPTPPWVPKRRLLLRQRLIIEIMQAIGYQADIGGVCYGIASMAVQSILIAGGITTFDNRLQLIHDALPLTLIKQFQKSLPKDMTRQEKADAMLSKIKLILREKKYTEEEIADVFAFFDAIELLTNPIDYHHLFETTNKPHFIDVEKIRPLILSSILESTTIEKISSFIGDYNEDKLTQYFQILRQALLSLSADQIAFSLHSERHTITIGYDSSRGWLFVDPNQLPTKLVKDDKEIARAVLAAFKTDSKITLLNTTYTTEKYKDNIIKSLTQLKDHPTWADIHAISAENHKRQANWLSLAIKHNCFNLTQNLLKHGADPNQRNELGETLLHIAIIKNDIKTLQLLLQHKANPNQADKEHHTPLYLAMIFAISTSDVAMLQLLLQYGADPNQKIDQSGQTPLHFAVEENKVEIVKILLEKGANLKNFEALLEAASNPEIKELLLKSFKQRHSNDQRYTNENIAVLFSRHKESHPTPAPRKRKEALPTPAPRKKKETPPIPTPRKKIPPTPAPRKKYNAR